MNWKLQWFGINNVWIYTFFWGGVKTAFSNIVCFYAKKALNLRKILQEL